MHTQEQRTYLENTVQLTLSTPFHSSLIWLYMKPNQCEKSNDNLPNMEVSLEGNTENMKRTFMSCHQKLSKIIM